MKSTGTGMVFDGSMNGTHRSEEAMAKARRVEHGSGATAVSRPARFGTMPTRRRRAVMVSALMAVVAAVVVIVSMSLAPVAQKTRQPASTATPGVPYVVVGWTYSSSGAPLAGASVNITDKTTKAYNNTIKSDSYGQYQYDLNGLKGGYTIGDKINITATHGSLIGWNETVAHAGSYFYLNVTLGTVIPEFGGYVIPVVGMLTVFAAVSLASSRRKK